MATFKFDPENAGFEDHLIQELRRIRRALESLAESNVGILENVHASKQFHLRKAVSVLRRDPND